MPDNNTVLEQAAPISIERAQGQSELSPDQIASKYSRKKESVTPASEETQTITTQAKPEPVKKEAKLKPETPAAAVKPETKVEPEGKTGDESVEDPENELTPQELAFQKQYFKDESPKPEGEKEKVAEVAATAKPEKKDDEVNKTYAEKAKTYDAIASNPLFKPLVDFVNSGGTSVVDFVKQLNIVDPSNLEIRDFIEMEARDLGMKDEDLQDAVDDELARFENLGIIEKRKKLKEYQENFKNSQNEKLKKFSVTANEENQRLEQLGQTSYSTLENKVQDLVKKSSEYKTSDGKNGGLYYGALLIDEPMAQEIKALAAEISTKLTDDNGKVIGYNIDQGIEAAINTLYGSQIRENIAKTARAIAIKEQLRLRHRPNENSTGTGSMPATKNSLESNMAQFRQQTKGI